MQDYAKIGTQLKKVRENKCLSYDQIFEVTRIQPSILKGIEEGQAGISPVFLKGFIRSYARALGLDPEKLFKELEAKNTDNKNEEATIHPESNKKEQKKKYYLKYSFPLVICFFVFSLVWFLNSSKKKREFLNNTTTQEQTKPLSSELGQNSDLETASNSESSSELEGTSGIESEGFESGMSEDSESGTQSEEDSNSESGTQARDNSDSESGRQSGKEGSDSESGAREDSNSPSKAKARSKKEAKKSGLKESSKNTGLGDIIQAKKFKQDVLIQSSKPLEVYFKLDKKNTITKNLKPLVWFRVKAQKSIYVRFDERQGEVRLFYNGKQVSVGETVFFEKTFSR